MDWNNKVVSLAGRFSDDWTRREISLWLEARGAEVRERYSKYTEILIVGTSPGQAPDKAREKGITIMSLEEMLQTDHDPDLQSMDQRLEALRGHLLGEPSKEAWNAIHRILLSWPEEEELEVGLNYARRHLDHWPDTIRVATNKSLDIWRRSGHEPRLQLSTYLYVNQLYNPSHIAETDAVMGGAHEVMPELRYLSMLGRNLRGERIDPVLDWPVMRTVEHLLLPNSYLDHESIERLVQHPNSHNIKTLILNNNQIGHLGLRHIAESPNMENLEKIELYGNACGVDGVTALGQSEYLTNLEHISLSHNYVYVEAFQELINSKFAPRLKHFNIKFNELYTEGCGMLAEATHVQSLEYLDIGANEIGDEGVGILAKAPHLKSLKTFINEGNRVLPLMGDEGAQALAQTEHLTGITTLNLNGNSIGDAGLRALMCSEAMSSVKTFDIGGNHISSEGMRVLLDQDRKMFPSALHMKNMSFQGCADVLRNADFTGLETLDVVGVRLGADDLEAFANNPTLNDLKELSLSEVYMTASACTKLFRGQFPSLERLSLSYCTLTKKEVQQLIDAPFFQNLTYLTLSRNSSSLDVLRNKARHSKLSFYPI